MPATLAIATPCHDGMYHTNYLDVVLAAATFPGFILFKSEYESDIKRHRSKMASQFLTDPQFKDCWGWVTVDADIGGYPDYLRRLASLPRDMHIVGGVYTKKKPPYDPVIRGLTEERHPADPDIVRCECVPTGFTRVTRECLQAVYDSKSIPNCRDEWRQVYDARVMESSLGLGYESEDYAFCLDAAKLGYKTWVDRGIRLSHRGHKTFQA